MRHCLLKRSRRDGRDVNATRRVSAEESVGEAPPSSFSSSSQPPRPPVSFFVAECGHSPARTLIDYAGVRGAKPSWQQALSRIATDCATDARGSELFEKMQ